jgi:sugar/nucleoside kinase (ribokinase family)
MPLKSCDVLVVGHFSLDSLKLPRRVMPCRVLGGAVAYVSLVTRQLGASAAVISKVGSDFPENYIKRLRDTGVSTSGIIKVPSEQTTSFELTYDEDLSSRRLILKAQSSPITLADLPSALSSKAIHIAPIAAEIPFEVIERLRSFSDCLSIDPQGMTRRFSGCRNVACCSQIDERILPLIDIYKSSAEEIGVLTGQSTVDKAVNAIHDLGPKIVIVTMGAKGSVLSLEGATYAVPACESKRVLDPTGAGDVLIGGFLTEFTRKKEPFWCACVGSAAASLKVENIGTTFLGEKDEIYRRANALYEKEIKH